jgi:hypothetical protein
VDGPIEEEGTHLWKWSKPWNPINVPRWDSPEKGSLSSSSLIEITKSFFPTGVLIRRGSPKKLRKTEKIIRVRIAHFNCFMMKRLGSFLV